MPFEICQACHLSTYSPRLRSLVDEVCPRCGAPIEPSASARDGANAERMSGRCRQWLTALSANSMKTRQH
jgi:hypothetical protein